MSPVATEPRRLDATAKQKVSYCIPIWLRDEQIRQNMATTPHRLERTNEVRTEPIAVVCYGPSLNDTIDQVRDFRYIISCSGAHKVLIEHGIIPTWHLDVDPRAHKIALMGEPHRDVEYLLASTCHPKHVRRLADEGYKLKLWHIFDAEDEALRVLPAGEWALTGGCSAGLRALAMARFLGFTQIDVFGMDGNSGPSGLHAAAHPNQSPRVDEVEVDGRIFHTTPSFLEAARSTEHELDDLRDVTARFHGDGLVQTMMRHYQRKPVKASAVSLAFNKPELISGEYRRLNTQLHHDNLAYGVGAGKHAPVVKKLVASLKGTDGLPPAVLDYGAGKRYLAKALPFPIFEYDPAIPSIAESPRPADLVCCLDVLEHIEPDKLIFVLDDLRRCVKQIGYFVINTKAARKSLPDGRNTHLIQEGQSWWTAQLGSFFSVAKVMERGGEIHVLVSPKAKVKPKKVAQLSVAVLKDAVRDAEMKLSFGGLTFRREPYLIGATPHVFPPTTYATLANSFPMDLSQYRHFTGGDVKWSLSEKNNPEAYHVFVQGHPAWKAFYDYIKSHAFTEKIVRVLDAHKVPLYGCDAIVQLRNRFEFSLLPARGGLLRPHTDLASKVITLVIAMPTPGEAWETAWGGGTDVLAQSDETQTFADYAAPADALTKAHTYEYVANQCVVFVKSDKSWHSVGPIQGVEGHWRRSLTINLERA